MKYTKLYQKDYRKSDNAEEALKNLSKAEIDDDVIGFIDEMASKQANTARLWGFPKPVKRVATYVKAKAA